MSDEVVTTADVAPKREPKAFSDLNKAQLEAAVDAFGSERGTKAEMQVNLVNDGVTWEQYAKAFKLPGYEEEVTEPETFEMPEPTNVEDWPDEGVNTLEESKVVAGSPTPQLAPQDKYLIRMTRENPSFQFEDKKFTQEKPYAIMDADQAQRILEREEGFRQAYPAELAEFYG